MNKINKYNYYKVLQGCYDGVWSDVAWYDTHKPEEMAALRRDVKTYRENEPLVRFSVINRRELNPDYVKMQEDEEERRKKGFKKYEVTLLFHTSVTVTVEVSKEADVIPMAYLEVGNRKYDEQLLHGLQADGDPEVKPL